MLFHNIYLCVFEKMVTSYFLFKINFFFSLIFSTALGYSIIFTCVYLKKIIPLIEIV